MAMGTVCPTSFPNIATTCSWFRIENGNSFEYEHSFISPTLAGFSYCSHQCTDATTTLLYLAGPKSMPLGGMNVDCDGANNSGGKCSNDPSGQGQTAFQDTVKSYGIPDLNANVHGYVVFGNEGAIPAFSPKTAGMKPLSVMAIVCGDNLVRLRPAFAIIL